MRITISIISILLICLTNSYAGSKTELLANKIVKKAESILSNKNDDENGIMLLKFALAAHPKNKNGLLLQGRLQSGVKSEESPFVSQIKEEDDAIIDLLQKLGSNLKKIGKNKRFVLYNKVASIIHPKNEKAMIILMEAQNAGMEISFDALLKAAYSKKKTGVAVKKKRVEDNSALTEEDGVLHVSYDFDLKNNKKVSYDHYWIDGDQGRGKMYVVFKNNLKNKKSFNNASLVLSTGDHGNAGSKHYHKIVYKDKVVGTIPKAGMLKTLEVPLELDVKKILKYKTITLLIRANGSDAMQISGKKSGKGPILKFTQ